MNALRFLHSLDNKFLRFSIKSPDTDLYEFCFTSDLSTDLLDIKKDSCTYVLHVLCRFKVIWRGNIKRIKTYYENTPAQQFQYEAERLVGLKVKRVALSEKNDLWIDFGSCWIVFATFENGEESWRLFIHNRDNAHLVASDLWLDFSG